MISEYAGILRKVQTLAEAGRLGAARAAAGSDPVEIGLINLADVKAYDYSDRSALREYLMTRDMYALEVIQAAMYIGRDYSPFTGDDLYYGSEEGEDVSARSEVSEDPEKLLADWMNEKVKDPDPNKNTEVDIIFDKLPLDRYLERAFVILGI